MDVLIGVVFAVLATVLAVFKWSGNTEEQSKANIVLERAKGLPSSGLGSPSPSIATSESATTVSSHQIPQESVLRRHYLSQLQTILETMTGPRPTDSVLSRHYDHHISTAFETCMEDNVHLNTVIAQFEAQLAAA